MRVSFTGDSDYKMVIQVPQEIYGLHMTGYCGNLDNNPNNDGNCPTGNDIDHCYPWHPLSTLPPDGYTTVAVSERVTTTRGPITETRAWTEVDTEATTARPASRTVIALTSTQQAVSEVTTGRPWYGNSTIATTTTSRPWVTDTTTTPTGDWCPPAIKPIVEAQCEPIINSTGPFQLCIEQVPDVAQTFYQACEFDLCAIGGANDSDIICNYLASFAAACMQEIPSLVIKWRSATLCPPSCPDRMHYDDCASSCPDTCGDPHASISCPLQCSGQCACDFGFVMDGGKCVPSTECGCTDSNGNYHKNGTSWVLQDCVQECGCFNEVISCVTLPSCGPHATCTVSDGQRACFCDEGYTGNACKRKTSHYVSPRKNSQSSANSTWEIIQNLLKSLQYSKL